MDFTTFSFLVYYRSFLKAQKLPFFFFFFFIKTSQAVGFVLLQLLMIYYSLLRLAKLRLAKRSGTFSKVCSSSSHCAEISLLYDDGREEARRFSKRRAHSAANGARVGSQVLQGDAEDHTCTAVVMMKYNGTFALVSRFTRGVMIQRGRPISPSRAQRLSRISLWVARVYSVGARPFAT